MQKIRSLGLKRFRVRSLLLGSWIVGVGGCVDEASGPAGDREQRVPLSAEAAGDEAGAAAVQSLPYARGGTRLKAHHYVSGDIEMFRFFYDVLRRTECQWSTPASGQGTRCLPARIVRLHFLDDKCSEPVLVGSAGMITSALGDGAKHSAFEEGGLVSVETTVGHPCHRRLLAAYGIGEAMEESDARAAALKLFAHDYRGACKPSANVQEPQHVRRVISLNESAFVAGHVARVETGSDLTVRRIQGEDGSQQTIGVSGPDGVGCTVLPEGPCVPGRMIDGGLPPRTAPVFDQECYHSPAPWPVAPFCGPPRFAIARGKAKPGDLAIYPLSQHPDPSTAQPYSCGLDETLPAAGSSNRFDLGPDVAATLARGRPVRVGHGPLYREQVVAQSTAQLIPLEPGQPLTDAKGVRCNVVRAVDGSHRCFSEDFDAQPTGVFYSDPACTIPLYGRYGKRPLSEIMIMNPPLRTGDVLPWIQEDLRTLWSVKVYEGPLYVLQDPAPRGGSPRACRLRTEKAPTDSGLFVPPFLIPDKPLPFSALPRVEAVAL